MRMKLLPENKGGKMKTGIKVTMWVLVILGALVALSFIFGGGKQQQTGTGNTVTTSNGTTTTCSSDLSWSGTVDVQNILNATGVETYDTTARFYLAGTNTLKTSITDTTAGSVTLTCGEAYDVRIQSTSGAAGDSARMKSISQGTVSPDGSFATFTATGTGNRITIGAEQHAVPEIQVYDNLNRGQVFALDGLTAYNATDGSVWNSTSIAGNVTAISSGGELNYDINVRAVANDENFNDLGTYFLVDAASNKWNMPVVKVNGATLTNYKSQLNPDEVKAYSSYEYVYKIDENTAITLQNKAIVSFDIFALSGVDPANPTDNIGVAFAPIGQYVSSANGNLLKIGSVKDDTSQTAVYNQHDLTFTVA